MRLIESGVAWIAGGIQRVGANFDFEVLALPGGSVLAILLWLYASAIQTVRHGAPRLRAVGKQNSSDVRSADCKQQLSTGVACVGCGCA